MAAQISEEPELPEEVTESLETFHEALGKVEDTFKPLLETSVDDLKEKMDPLQSAKLDLVVAYSINSMFWMYLTTQGVNPRQHPVKSELDRIKKYMGKVKEATEKKEASLRLDKGAAKRFVKSALWQPDAGKTPEASHKEEEPPQKGESKKSEKRKSEGKLAKSTEKKKKKKR
ncbi:nuclear nucleic acid-binding protein C1D-like isoform X2 [Stylophora pistillata]|uniref:nuclear nucleic acid-binding protein C1D-like isoform X2 n=1 Tax=Stylophora pistillata TaxID=50429 RepID=UPI000C03E148|nr:nuclear nucleic acid-binding protein C1D-like isoform X2 [Stylophora pistillata]